MSDEIVPILEETRLFSRNKSVIKNGFFANVIDVGNGNDCIAISTDGVGSKTLIAQMLNKYDTIGIDCVAMNVNDILCVGALPISMVDYIAVEKLEYDLIHEIAKGLVTGAMEAEIEISGGETAVLGDIINGFDLSGTCIGTVNKHDIIDGSNINSGDLIIGVQSSGIHSNGLTAARKILNNRNPYIPELRMRALDALLTPSTIYVEMMRKIYDFIPRQHIKGIVHNTGGGLKNIARLNTPHRFILSEWEIPPIFQWLSKMSKENFNACDSLDDFALYETFNMGMGMFLVCSEGAADDIVSIINKLSYGNVASVVGTASSYGPYRVTLYDSYGAIKAGYGK